MVLVKPANVVQWHRRGFRKYWRWRSRSRRAGRPEVNREIRELIRQMSLANELWGAPRIHGEMLKLDIEVRQGNRRETYGPAAWFALTNLEDLPVQSSGRHRRHRHV
jgi:hypothetical protein